MIKCRVLSWDEVYNLAKSVARKVKESGYKVDAIVGVARGGWFHARVLCDFLGVKDLYSIKVGHWGITAEKDGKAKLHQGLNVSLENKNVLLVDDITDTGESLELAKKHVLEEGKPKDLKTATLQHIKTSKYKPDFYGEETEWAWMIYPWNYYEDLCNLTLKMLDKPQTKGEIVENFKENHGISIPINDVEEVIDMLLDRREIKVVERDGKDTFVKLLGNFE